MEFIICINVSLSYDVKLASTLAELSILFSILFIIKRVDTILLALINKLYREHAGIRQKTFATNINFFFITSIYKLKLIIIILSIDKHPVFK